LWKMLLWTFMYRFLWSDVFFVVFISLIKAWYL
jgi:hypothetical protein